MGSGNSILKEPYPYSKVLELLERSEVCSHSDIPDDFIEKIDYNKKIKDGKTLLELLIEKEDKEFLSKAINHITETKNNLSLISFVKIFSLINKSDISNFTNQVESLNSDDDSSIIDLALSNSNLEVEDALIKGSFLYYDKNEWLSNFLPEHHQHSKHKENNRTNNVLESFLTNKNSYESVQEHLWFSIINIQEIRIANTIDYPKSSPQILKEKKASTPAKLNTIDEENSERLFL